MPRMTDEELEASIASGRIGAITLDTSIFDRFQCNLRYASLYKLGQFDDSHIRVLISEVVAAEVKAHLQRDAAKSQRDLRSALGTHLKRWHLHDRAVFQPLDLDREPADFAAQQFAAYVERVKAEIVPAARSRDVAQRVMQRYFETAAPFEAGEKKKNEFPDAFALLSLEEEAVEHGTLTLCVSTDAGWLNFADDSAHLVCMRELDPVLDMFNETGRTIAQRAMSLIIHQAVQSVADEIDRAFEYVLDDQPFDITVDDSPFAYEEQPIGAVLENLDWSLSTPNVIAQDADSITFTTKVKAEIEFTASFEFHVRDSVDGDDVSIGRDTVSTKRLLQFDVAFIISRDWDDEPDVFEATVSKRGMTAHFGRIDPFRHEDITHEKY